MVIGVDVQADAATEAPRAPPSRTPAPPGSPPRPEEGAPAIAESPTPIPAPYIPPVAGPEAPSHRIPVPIRAYPRIVVVAGTVHNSTIIANKRSVIARRISDIHLIGG